MDRRAFLKTIGLGVVAAAAPAILVPTRTIIDMKPRYSELWAQDGDDLSDLMRYLAPGGTLFVEHKKVYASRTLYFGRDYRIVMNHSRFEYHQGTGIYIQADHASGAWHQITHSHLEKIGEMADSAIRIESRFPTRSAA